MKNYIKNYFYLLKAFLKKVKECENMLELEENKQRIQSIKLKLQSIGDSL